MQAAELKALQAPLKDIYRQDAKAALITLTAEGRIGEGVTCSVATGQGARRSGASSGDRRRGHHACSGDMLLRGARRLRRRDPQCGGDRAWPRYRRCHGPRRGRSRFPRHAWPSTRKLPVGFRDIRLTFDIDGDLSEEQRASLIKLTERYCVVYQTLRSPPPVG